MMVSTCGRPVVGSLVWSAVNETSQAAHSMWPNQDVAAKCSAVHHPNIERGMEKLIFWKVLWSKSRKKTLVKSNVFFKDVDLTSKQPFSMGLNIKWSMHLPLQTIWPGCWNWDSSCSSGWAQIERLCLHTLCPHGAYPPELSWFSSGPLIPRTKPEPENNWDVIRKGGLKSSEHTARVVVQIHLYAVATQYWPDAQRHREDGSTLWICRPLKGGEVSPASLTNLIRGREGN